MVLLVQSRTFCCSPREAGSWRSLCQMSRKPNLRRFSLEKAPSQFYFRFNFSSSLSHCDEQCVVLPLEIPLKVTFVLVFPRNLLMQQVVVKAMTVTMISMTRCTSMNQCTSNHYSLITVDCTLILHKNCVIWCVWANMKHCEKQLEYKQNIDFGWSDNISLTYNT